MKLIVIGATLVPEFMYVPSTISYENEEEEEAEEVDRADSSTGEAAAARPARLPLWWWWS